MPNPGGLQLGCEVCRRRRIKCDRSRPDCRRCIKYGSVCPGYPQEQDIRFRHETDKTAQRVASVSSTSNQESNRNPNRTSQRLVSRGQTDSTVESSNSARDSHRESQPSSPFGESRAMSALPPCSMNMSWDVVLAQYFFDQVIMSVGWYSYLPQLYYRSLSNGCMKVTTTAAAFFLAANQFQDASMLQRAIHEYGTALHVINAAIAHPQRCIEDETLSSILLLNVLDDLVGHRSSARSSHLNACAELIKLRDTKGLRTECTPHLAHSLVIQTQKQLMQGHKLEICSLNDGPFLTWLWTKSLPTPASKLSALSLQIGKIRDAATHIFSHRPNYQADFGATLLALIGDIHSLDIDMINWHMSGNSRWTQKSAALDLPSGEQKLAYYYSDVQVSKVWNHWRVARIILHDTSISIIECLRSSNISLNREHHDLERSKVNSFNIIKDMITGVFASIPFHMQTIDPEGRPTTRHSQRVLGGCALIWPLQMILKSRWMSTAQKNKAVESLQMIGAVFGVKQALVYLEDVLCSKTPDKETPSPALCSNQ